MWKTKSCSLSRRAITVTVVESISDTDMFIKADVEWSIEDVMVLIQFALVLVLVSMREVNFS